MIAHNSPSISLQRVISAHGPLFTHCISTESGPALPPTILPAPLSGRVRVQHFPSDTNPYASVRVRGEGFPPSFAGEPALLLMGLPRLISSSTDTGCSAGSGAGWAACRPLLTWCLTLRSHPNVNLTAMTAQGVQGREQMTRTGLRGSTLTWGVIWQITGSF